MALIGPELRLGSISDHGAFLDEVRSARETDITRREARPEKGQKERDRNESRTVLYSTHSHYE